MAQPMNQDKIHKNDNESISAVSAVRDDLIKTLENISVSELQFSAKAIVLDYELDPKIAIETLLQHKIRAAPVLEKGKFIGVLDLRDTVKYALESYDAFKNNDEQKIENKKEAKKYITAHSSISTSTLSQLCAHRQFKYVKQTDCLLNVACLFADGCHVVGVINDKNNELIGIITQGYFFQQIAKKWKFRRGTQCLLKKIAELKYITCPVETINKNIRAYNAFKVMIDADLSGLAVINNEGVIIHNTSATDIKLWLLSSHMLEDTVEQFLITVRNLSLIERYPVSTCKLDDTFERAIQMLEATKYHRIWIVNEHRQPIGVLALTDVFQFICKKKE